MVFYSVFISYAIRLFKSRWQMAWSWLRSANWNCIHARPRQGGCECHPLGISKIMTSYAVLQNSLKTSRASLVLSNFKIGTKYRTNCKDFRLRLGRQNWQFIILCRQFALLKNSSGRAWMQVHVSRCMHHLCQFQAFIAVFLKCQLCSRESQCEVINTILSLKRCPVLMCAWPFPCWYLLGHYCADATLASDTPEALLALDSTDWSLLADLLKDGFCASVWGPLRFTHTIIVITTAIRMTTVAMSIRLESLLDKKALGPQRRPVERS